MQLAKFNAFCPLEIGDKVIVPWDKEIKTITDIACVHLIKSGTVEFELQLDEDKTRYSLAGLKILKVGEILGGAPNLGTKGRGYLWRLI